VGSCGVDVKIIGPLNVNKLSQPLETRK
jgi:hypothetical protein